MKIAVITRHAISNYGSLLQAIATQRIIENLGHSCEIIDYIRTDESCTRQEHTLLNRKAQWNSNPLKKAVYLAIRLPESVAAGVRFGKARKKYLKLSQRYSCLDDLKNNPPAADVYMTGSDQVWGPVADGSYDSAYCLSFTENKKIAYAASFGHSQITPELQKYYQQWLSMYDHVAVREDSAVQFLGEIGIAAQQVLDPTLVLTAEDWHSLVKPIKEGKYVLVYQLHNNKRLCRYAQAVAKAKGLPLIRISASFHQISWGGKFLWCPDLSTFLSYIKNAECLITDSFHGTAFAINFNTPFVEVMPNNNTGTRNVSILKLTNLSDRILQDEQDVGLANKEIDFSYANEILKAERIRSLAILQKMIADKNAQ